MERHRTKPLELQFAQGDGDLKQEDMGRDTETIGLEAGEEDLYSS